MTTITSSKSYLEELPAEILDMIIGRATPTARLKLSMTNKAFHARLPNEAMFKALRSAINRTDQDEEKIREVLHLVVKTGRNFNIKKVGLTRPVKIYRRNIFHAVRDNSHGEHDNNLLVQACDGIYTDRCSLYTSGCSNYTQNMYCTEHAIRKCCYDICNARTSSGDYCIDHKVKCCYDLCSMRSHNLGPNWMCDKHWPKCTYATCLNPTTSTKPPANILNPKPVDGVKYCHEHYAVCKFPNCTIRMSPYSYESDVCDEHKCAVVYCSAIKTNNLYCMSHEYQCAHDYCNERVPSNSPLCCVHLPQQSNGFMSLIRISAVDKMFMY